MLHLRQSSGIGARDTLRRGVVEEWASFESFHSHSNFWEDLRTHIFASRIIMRPDSFGDLLNTLDALGHVAMLLHMPATVSATQMLKSRQSPHFLESSQDLHTLVTFYFLNLHGRHGEALDRKHD